MCLNHVSSQVLPVYLNTDSLFPQEHQLSTPLQIGLGASEPLSPHGRMLTGSVM